ncbi:hypothetical protein MUS1_06350 [Marinomonas ushuaiensis DSM 15871]|uniref:Porin n=1 Tax=Marinomonas ushuaiensis DSM 15871 TaxID=1122207 RepID=X7E0Z0_9GAMM|nr:hypothetical protein [Marinomonas ushuaiensis]ETX09632.1 hypothetical protein MUS1_06350 [Marinomonas ushuaiensis DSM 15871]
MNALTKTTLALLAATVISTAAFANSDALAEAQYRVDAISAQLESMGAEVDSSVDLNAAATPIEQEAALVAKYEELQIQLENLQAKTAE